MFRKLLWGAVLVAATLALQHAVAAEGKFALPFTAVHKFHSKVNGVDYSLYIRTPSDYANSHQVYPVIYILDADYAFPAAVSMMDMLQRFRQAPKAILVAIAYPGQYPDEDKYRRTRTRDYTPPPPSGSPPLNGYGGAPKFLRVIQNDVIPYVDENFRTNPANRTLVGHSYGGLFASWVLHENASLFHRYLIVSPSLWYGNEMILKREAARETPDLPDRTLVYLAVGSEESPKGGAQMIDEVKRFAQLMEARADPNLVIQQRVFEEETHASIFPVAFSTGIRHLFGEMDGSRAGDIAVGTGD